MRSYLQYVQIENTAPKHPSGGNTDTHQYQQLMQDITSKMELLGMDLYAIYMRDNQPKSLGSRFIQFFKNESNSVFVREGNVKKGYDFFFNWYFADKNFVLPENVRQIILLQIKSIYESLAMAQHLRIIFRSESSLPENKFNLFPKPLYSHGHFEDKLGDMLDTLSRHLYYDSSNTLLQKVVNDLKTKDQATDQVLMFLPSKPV